MNKLSLQERKMIAGYLEQCVMWGASAKNMSPEGIPTRSICRLPVPRWVLEGIVALIGQKQTLDDLRKNETLLNEVCGTAAYMMSDKRGQEILRLFDKQGERPVVLRQARRLLRRVDQG